MSVQHIKDAIMKKVLFLVVMGSIGLSQPKEKMNINGYVL
ncbi:uncharacterized protein METZ01_LOCUS231005, partial [marine metagenome]